MKENICEIINAINKFKCKNLHYDITKSIDYNINNYLVEYNNCFAGVNPPILYIKTKINHPFFRLRKLCSIKDIDDVNEYSYPRNNFVMGRANMPNKPVFYCSTSPITTIRESKKHSRDAEYVISKWKLKDENIELKIIPTFTNRTEHIFNNTIKKDGIKAIEKQKEYLKFIGEQILSKNYSNSAFLAYNLIYNNKYDIIRYPSIGLDKHPNMAISPQLIDNGTIILDKVYMVKVSSDFDITLNKIGVFGKNKPIWISNENIEPNSELAMEYRNYFKSNK